MDQIRRKMVGMGTKGFTLIEMLIVIAIIAALAGALIPVMRGSKLEAQIARARSDLDAIKTASMMMHMDCGPGGWPAGSASPGTNTGADFLSDVAPANAGWGGPYLDQWKNDPWGVAYTLIDVGVVRTITSFGPDGVIGGGDNETLIMTSDTTK